MRHRWASVQLLVALILAPPAAALAQGAPLDVGDPTPRNVFVQLETSSNLATVGQSFGLALPATWSASGGVGTLVIPVASHEAMRTGGLQPVPGTFTEYVIQIDVTTLHATSQPPTSGAMESGPLTMFFAQGVLSTNATAGFVDPTVAPLLCTSQQQVDDWCAFFPPLCGQTCTLVPGSAYDPGSGKVNLVGGVEEQGCDGPGACNGPFVYFSPFGDLRLLEANVVPALPWPAAASLASLLLATTVFALRVRRSARRDVPS